MPVTWVKETLLPFDTVRMERSRVEAEELGRTTLEKHLTGLLGGDGEIVSSRIASAARGDWLLVTLSAECIEQIGEVVPIPMN